jgi:hypothetical protein
MTKPITDRALCGRPKRQSEGNCGRPAGWGTDHAGRGPCKLHGGSAPQVTRTAKQALVEFHATRQLANLDVAPVTDPLTELAKLAGQVIAWRDILAEQVNQLTSIRYEAETGGEQLRSEIAVFERAMDRCINVLGTIGRLKIDERLVRIEQQRVDLVVDALQGTLQDIGLDPDARAQAVTGLVRRLRLATG